MANLLDTNLTDYIGLHPCVTCLNGKELDSIIIALLATKAGYSLPDDLTTLIDTTACLKCLNDTQGKQSMAAFLWEQQSPNSTDDELIAQAKCLQCVDPQVMKALYGYLLALGLTPAAPT